MSQGIAANMSRVFMLLLILGSACWLETAADEKTCIKCKSSDDSNCIADLSKITTFAEKCASDCFVSTDANGEVIRDCLAESEAEKCKNDSACKTCSGDKCNNHNICKLCDSSKKSECAQTDSSTLENEICGTSTTKCAAQIDANGNTVRGCATADIEKKCATDSTTCLTCTGGNCNVDIFPKNRISCKQCADTDACASGTAVNALPCTLYKADDLCYMFASDATHVQRGCISDSASTNKCQQPTSNTACATCKSNDCNSQTYERDQQLKCVQCTAAKDKNCAWSQQASSATTCTNKLKYTQLDACYARTSEGKEVSRGCLYDLDESAQKTCLDASDTTCTTCNIGDGCNNKDTGVMSCIRCRSDEDDKCIEKPTKSGQCRNAVTEETAKCFTGMWNGILIRGCMVDVDEQMAYTCNTESNKDCTVCSGSDCNNVKWNGAVTMVLSKALLLVAVLAALSRLQ